MKIVFERGVTLTQAREIHKLADDLYDHLLASTDMPTCSEYDEAHDDLGQIVSALEEAIEKMEQVPSLTISGDVGEVSQVLVNGVTFVKE